MMRSICKMMAKKRQGRGNNRSSIVKYSSFVILSPRYFSIFTAGYEREARQRLGVARLGGLELLCEEHRRAHAKTRLTKSHKVIHVRDMRLTDEVQEPEEPLVAVQLLVAEKPLVLEEPRSMMCWQWQQRFGL